MPALRINIAIDQKGAIFSVAQTRAAGRRMVTAMNDLIAQEGVNRVHTHLRQVLQNPTGYYDSKIVVQRRSMYRGIWDSNVVYGGWLEGVTSRNRTTRFKGYHTFRLVKQSLDKDSRRIVAPAIARYIQEMNS